MKLIMLLVSITALMIAGCQSMNQAVHVEKFQTAKVQNKKIETIGYSTTDSFKHFPQAQQKLLAIRGAKLDAYRNLAEEVFGIKIKGKSTVRDMVVQNDSYRTYVNTMLRGAHIESITETKKGFFEAEVSITLTPKYTSCLYNPSEICLNSSNQYQPDVINNEPLNVSTQTPVGIYNIPHSGHFSYPAVLHHGEY